MVGSKTTYQILDVFLKRFPVITLQKNTYFCMDFRQNLLNDSKEDGRGTPPRGTDKISKKALYIPYQVRMGKFDLFNLNAVLPSIGIIAQLGNS